MFGHMHESLNAVEKITNYTVTTKCATIPKPTTFHQLNRKAAVKITKDFQMRGTVNLFFKEIEHS